MTSLNEFIAARPGFAAFVVTILIIILFTIFIGILLTFGPVVLIYLMGFVGFGWIWWVIYMVFKVRQNYE